MDWKGVSGKRAMTGPEEELEVKEVLGHPESID